MGWRSFPRARGGAPAPVGAASQSQQADAQMEEVGGGSGGAPDPAYLAWWHANFHSVHQAVKPGGPLGNMFPGKFVEGLSQLQMFKQDFCFDQLPLPGQLRRREGQLAKATGKLAKLDAQRTGVQEQIDELTAECEQRDHGAHADGALRVALQQTGVQAFARPLTGSRPDVWQSVGISIPTPSAASRSVCPSSASTSTPSIVSFIPCSLPARRRAVLPHQGRAGRDPAQARGRRRLVRDLGLRLSARRHRRRHYRKVEPVAPVPLPKPQRGPVQVAPRRAGGPARDA